jgi:hypothetical protein|tara:strand:+ start:413 stop:598 length:186 start_codon:yes stop_codon:yes gene_type:complete
MGDSEKIANIIEVMRQLKELEQIYSKECDVVIMSLILALIHNTIVPDVTILPNNKEEIAIA